MHYIPGLRLRVNERIELAGIDESEMGEVAYDYVQLEPEIQPFAQSTSLNMRDGRAEEYMMKERQSSHTDHV